MVQEWNGFVSGEWQREINVRDFIQKNYTPYEGDESFLEGATDATKKLWAQVMELSEEERKKGGVLDMDTKIISRITSHGPGYLNQEIEKIVGFQTDKPFKRALQPYGGIRMAVKACEENGYHVDSAIVEFFMKHRKTHNDGVFDAYTKEMRACRSSHIITGLPDAYGRGRIIGDYRRVALYGVDRLIEDKQRQFKLLCSKLEEMKIVFKLQYKGIEIFPIGKLLAVVIGSEYIFEKLDEVTLNTFLLALEIFDTEIYAAEKNKLNKIIDECNLKCLSYLSDQSTLRIGGSAWKENFKHNGVLILGNVTQGKIYIRHPEKVYFSSLKGEKRNKLDSEKNSAHRDIAYFYEDSYDPAAIFMSIRDIMTSGNPNLQIAAIREIYNNKSYNVFFDKAFIKVGDNVQVVNQFTAEDTILIFENGEIRDANVSNITEYAMKPFSLIKIIGEGLDYVILGSICKLLRICSVQIDSIMNELKNVHKNYQDNLIVIWSKYTTDFYKSVLELQKEYFEDVLYIKKRKTIVQKGISDISWIPVKLPIQFLENKLLESCGETIKDRIEKVLLEKDEDFEGNVVYRDIKNNIEIPSEFLVMKQDDDLKKDRFFSIKYQDRYFVSNEIDSYIKIMRKIEDANENL